MYNVLFLLMQAKSGVEVESTEVALAFPLSNQRNMAQVGHRSQVNVLMSIAMQVRENL